MICVQANPPKQAEYSLLFCKIITQPMLKGSVGMPVNCFTVYYSRSTSVFMQLVPRYLLF